MRGDAKQCVRTVRIDARIESTRKLKSLVLVESPALPESAEYPRRVYSLVGGAPGGDRPHLGSSAES